MANATTSKPSRNQVAALARELGFPFPSSDSNKLVDQAMRSDDPEKFLREQLAARAVANTPPASPAPAASSAPAAASSNAGASEPAAACGPGITLRLPIGDPPAKGYARRFSKCELRLEGDTAETFGKLYFGLHNASARLQSGRHVETAADVMRYILEQSAAAMATANHG